MRTMVKRGVALGWGLCVSLFAGSPAAVAQYSGGSVTATATALTPNPVTCGQPATATLDATATPPTSSDPYSSLSGPTWSWVVNATAPGQIGVNQLNPPAPAATLTAAITSPGGYALSATATATWTDSNGNTYVVSGTTAPIPITVVAVQKLQYLQGGGGGYVDVSGTLYVLVGQSVTFNAVPAPGGSTYPSSQPVWSGSSGASGSGATVSVAFNQLSASTSDYQTVTATCGNSSATVSVIVFDLLPVLTPQDNFDGRDLTAYGVCEYVYLSYQTTPAGINDYEIGGLQWQITSGGGTLSGGAGGVNIYQGPDVATTVTLGLAITGGPMLGLMKAADPKDIVLPDGIKQIQAPKTGIYHSKGFVSIGFRAGYYATSTKNVSYKRIECREGACLATATGYWAGVNNAPHAPSSNWFAVTGDLEQGKGYPLDGVDTVEEPKKSPQPALMAGTFTWPIPILYRKIGDTGDGTTFATATHDQSCDDAGKITIQKAGAGPFSKNLNDPDSTY